jgi:ribosomal protein S18 acetylase RimI-like enzyme
MITPLDNPVWEALSSRQIHFNKGNDILKYFPATVSPFVGLQHWNKTDLEELISLLPADRSFSVMNTKEVTLPASFEIVFTTPLYQMYCPVLKPFNNPAIGFRKLYNADIPQMLELTDNTKPGPFYERTIDFGNYIGIFNNDKLVAMAGERLKVNGYTEASAICTHPDFLGKGYASYLLSKVSEQIIQEASIPFLHVRSDNSRAIEVYKKLGFQIRANVYFAIFKKGD